MSAAPAPAPTVTVRRAGPDDAGVIRDLAARTWRVSYRGIVPDAQIEYMLAGRYAEAPLRSALTEGSVTFELLFQDGRPAAFAAHGPGETANNWKLHQLYVLPECQRGGLGSLLIRHVEAAARAAGRTALELTVNRHNTAAQAAYARNGFQFVEARCTDIGSGFVMDDFILRKTLE